MAGGGGVGEVKLPRITAYNPAQGGHDGGASQAPLRPPAFAALAWYLPFPINPLVWLVL